MNSSLDIRKYLALRFDFNLTKANALEIVFNRQRFDPVTDFSRGFDPAYPGFQAGEYSARPRTETIALHSNLGRNLVNEFRYGHAGGGQSYDILTPADFASTQGFHLDITSIGFRDPYPSPTNFGNSRRVDPVHGWNSSNK